MIIADKSDDNDMTMMIMMMMMMMMMIMTSPYTIAKATTSHLQKKKEETRQL